MNKATCFPREEEPDPLLPDLYRIGLDWSPLELSSLARSEQFSHFYTKSKVVTRIFSQAISSSYNNLGFMV